LLCNRRINKGPFLSNGSVNSRGNENACNNMRTAISIWSVKSDYKEENRAIQLVEGWQFSRALQESLSRYVAIVELTVDNSCALAAVARGPERGKLKNVHC
jgi:hypothetical protein